MCDEDEIQVMLHQGWTDNMHSTNFKATWKLHTVLDSVSYMGGIFCFSFNMAKTNLTFSVVFCVLHGVRVAKLSAFQRNFLQVLPKFS